ncbi:hypothetical protein ACFW04_006537 [Cataglyphis niger]
MCGKNLTFCHSVLLLVISSLTFQLIYMSHDNEDNNLTVRYEFDEDIKRNCDKKAELVRYNLHKNFTNDNKNKYNNGNNDKNHIVSNEMYNNITCIKLCCPFGDRLVNKNCIAEENEYALPNVYGYLNNSMQNENKKINELFPLIVQNPCQETIHFLLYPDYFFKYYKYIFFANGSLYLPYFDIFVESTSYCLAVVDHNQFDAIICLEAVNETINKEMDKIINNLYNEILSKELIITFFSCRIMSMLCLLSIFLVYSILPELHSIHSFMLRRYSSLSFIAYTVEIIDYLFNMKDLAYSMSLVNYFCFLTSSFWLSVMSFDMWWTFRDLFSFQRNVKQERKKFIYSTIAWGGPFILTIICIIMEFIPSVPKKFIRPEFGVDSCWFHEDAASQLYYYGPKSICIISSICLSIYTILKIMRYEKDTTRHLKDLENQSYNDNKRWFNLYLKLFIMLFIIIAINWIISTMLEFWLVTDNTIRYIIRSIILMDTMQDICIFIIFVCKKTIMQLLLKHFCQNRGSVFKTTQSSCHRLQQLQLCHHVKDNFSVEKH